ncbi:MAG: hypothetical protein AB1416_09605 [Actinomycetota bacterium]
MSDTAERVTVEAGGASYILEPQAVRTSLTDSTHMLWGFEVYVRRGDDLVGVKTCFVGRVSVQAADPASLDGPIDGLVPVLHRLALAKVRERLEAGEPGDEIVFA